MTAGVRSLIHDKTAKHNIHRLRAAANELPTMEYAVHLIEILID